MRLARWAVVVLLLGGCGSPSTPSPATAEPDDVARTFLRAAAAGDCEAARQVTATPSEFDCTMADGFAQLIGDVDPDDIDIEVASTSGSSAIVDLKLASGTSELQMQQVAGDWLVVVDSAA